MTMGSFLMHQGQGDSQFKRWLDQSSRNQKSQKLQGVLVADPAIVPCTGSQPQGKNNGALVETSPFVDPGLVLRKS